ncbi:MAG: ferredoxin [Chitinivibrionales bacterium]|nr:ferredoxin [Chitinivibrionales bacterium]MBD3394370.1 ferredoxin [Chitinivibrionales bacterium]
MGNRMRYVKGVSTLDLDVSKCTGCERCTEVCPHGVFVMENGKAHIIDKDLCMECGACRLNCESAAISVEAGVGCAAAIIYGILAGTEPQCSCTPSEGSGACC